jgi:hypothetical protein
MKFAQNAGEYRRLKPASDWRNKDLIGTTESLS